MITIFNRKELLVTNSMEQQSRVRDLLSENNISYNIKVINLSSGNGYRGFRGSYGINQNLIYEYKIYVHKNDYNKAIKVINNNIEK